MDTNELLFRAEKFAGYAAGGSADNLGAAELQTINALTSIAYSLLILARDIVADREGETRNSSARVDDATLRPRFTDEVPF